MSDDVASALDAVPCGILSTSDSGTILRANRVFCSWTGYESSELVGVRRFQDLLTIGARIFHQTHWAPLLQMQGSIAEIKLDIMHRDGTTLPAVFNAVRRTEGDTVIQEIAAFVARDRDTYERELMHSRKQLEKVVDELRRLEAEAKDRALAAEQMIGIVSHDLRNPLSSIGVATALLADDELTEHQRRTLERAARATDRANHLIDDLLDFTQTRLGTGLSVSLAELDLHTTVRQVVDELGSLYSGRTLRHVRTGAGVCRGDTNRIAQLVGNLVSNAMTYGDVTQPVTVSTSITSSAYTIEVHNGGPAIPVELQARIFQPMTRATGASASKSVGLGLYIVQEIAKAHAGNVRLESSTENGTRVIATFPCGNRITT